MRTRERDRLLAILDNAEGYSLEDYHTAVDAAWAIRRLMRSNGLRPDSPVYPVTDEIGPDKIRPKMGTVADTLEDLKRGGKFALRAGDGWVSPVDWLGVGQSKGGPILFIRYDDMRGDRP